MPAKIRFYFENTKKNEKIVTKKADYRFQERLVGLGLENA